MPDAAPSRINPGHIQFNAAPCGDQATIAVTGIGRTGTTMIVRILAALGVQLGPELTRKAQEERQIVRMMKANDMEGFARLCRKRNRRHDVWGFKCPAASHRLPKVDEILRAPRHIITSRDAVASTTRNAIELDVDQRDALLLRIRKQHNLIRTLLKLDSPVLLISYEKALAYPVETVALIAEFSGIDIDRDQAAEIAAAQIRSNGTRYLNPAPPPAPADVDPQQDSPAQESEAS